MKSAGWPNSALGRSSPRALRSSNRNGLQDFCERLARGAAPLHPETWVGKRTLLVDGCPAVLANDDERTRLRHRPMATPELVESEIPRRLP